MSVTLDRRYDKSLHDPAFGPFPIWSGTVPPGRTPEWSGVLTRSEYAGWSARAEPWFAQPILPEINDEYPEWVALLTSITEAHERGDRFVMAELGAGWGRWIVNAAACIRQTGWDLPYRLIGVEAEPRHVAWMRQHVRDNGLDPADFDLRHAAMGNRNGTVAFMVGPKDEQGRAWFGQSVPTEDARYGGQTVTVPSLLLTTLLRDYPRVDLLDLDLQGAEWTVLVSGQYALKKVRRVFVGTHSTENEARLRAFFTRLGWACEHDYPLQATNQTRWGAIAFGDGVQVWRNPKV